MLVLALLTRNTFLHVGVKTLDSQSIIGHITGAIFWVKNGQNSKLL